jgi:hypothetical protein
MRGDVFRGSLIHTLKHLPEIANYLLNRTTSGVPLPSAIASLAAKIGDRTVQLQHACQKIAQWIDRPGDRVIRALSWLGKDAARDPIAIDTLRLNTPDPVKADLMKGLDMLPVWMRSIVRNLCDDSLMQR